MQQDHLVPVHEDSTRLLDELIQARLGPGVRYAVFFGSGEGRYLPETRIEEESGYVLSGEDRVYFFWLGWDAEMGKPALTRWREQKSRTNWEQDGEYQRARARLGLS